MRYDKKKIVFVVSSMGRGGAERVISLLSSHFIAQGHRVEIVMTLHSIVEYDIDERVVITDLSDDSKNRIEYLPKMLVKLRRHIKNISPDVVVAFMDINALFVRMALLGLKVRIVASERNDPSQVKSWLLRNAYIWAYSGCDAVVIQTKRVMNYFPEKIKKRGVIIGNPISVTTSASGEQRPLIVTAGRLEKQKNHEMLINAFSRIHQVYPNYVLEIYGDGSLKEKLQIQAEQLGISNSVIFMGVSSNIHEKIKDAQVFALSSNFEGLSNAMLEAMMMGIPVVSTNCAGADEVITNGENGMLSPIGDAEKFSDNLLLLLEDCSLRKKMSEKAKKVALEYSEEYVFSKWDDIIIG